MNHSTNEKDQIFSDDEIVDIIDPKYKTSYEGKVISIKGDKLIVENLKNHKEFPININENRVIKRWIPGKPIKKFNRVDFRLKDTDYWVEGIVEEIRDNNKILIKYKNNNNFMPIVREEVSINDQRLAMPGLYTKIEGNNNDLLASTTLNFDLSKKNTLELNLSKNYDDSDLNLSKTKLLSNKTNCPDNDDNNSLIDENEYEFAIELLTINLRIKKVNGDGNCMFRAVSDQVYGTDKYYDILRQKCMDYLVILRRFFEPYIYIDFDTYIKEKRKDKVWGDDVELEALSELYNRPIEIYDGSSIPRKTFHENNYSQYCTKNINCGNNPIRLSYHKGNHYNSLVPLEDDKIKYRRYKDGLIKTSPGIYESKMISCVEEDEVRLDKGL